MHTTRKYTTVAMVNHKFHEHCKVQSLRFDSRALACSKEVGGFTCKAEGAGDDACVALGGLQCQNQEAQLMGRHQARPTTKQVAC